MAAMLAKFRCGGLYGANTDAERSDKIYRGRLSTDISQTMNTYYSTTVVNLYLASEYLPDFFPLRPTCFTSALHFFWTTI
eukprot:scaffold4353_cov130-Chaetoceros_neogracile.AAC.1